MLDTCRHHRRLDDINVANRCFKHSVTGRDATDEFEDVGHSDSAKAMMAEYYVGEIDSSTLPERTTAAHVTHVDEKPDKQTEFLNKMLWVLVPLAILGLAMFFRMQIGAKE